MREIADSDMQLRDGEIRREREHEAEEMEMEGRKKASKGWGHGGSEPGRMNI